MKSSWLRYKWKQFLADFGTSFLLPKLTFSEFRLMRVLRLLQRCPLIKICEKLWKQRANWACSMSAANLNLSFVWDLSVCDESRLTTEDLKGCVFKNVSGKVNRQENYQRQKSYLEQIHQNDVYVQLKLRTNEKQCFLQSQYISWAMFSRRSITIVLSVIALQS